MADEDDAGNPRALTGAGGSPLTAFPDPVRTEAALRSLDLLIAIDVQHNPLTRIATHVLPAAGQLERADLVVETQTVYASAVVDPVADRRPLWWHIAEIGRRLGHDPTGGFDPEGATDDSLIRAMAAGGRDGAEALMAAGSRGVDPPRLYGWVREHALPERRFRLAPAELLERLPGLLRRPRADRGEMLLVSGRLLGRTNATAYFPAPKSREVASLHVHPDDARKATLSKGDPARLESEAGTLEVHVEIDPDLRPGVVWLSHGWHETNVGRLTSGYERVDPLTGQPQMTALPVRLERISDPAAPGSAAAERT